MWHAFLDESRRGPTYLVAVVVVQAHDCNEARAAMRRLTKPGQRRVHFNVESDRRRRDLLARIGDLGLRGRVWHCRDSDDVTARQVCLSAVVPKMIDLRVSRLVLESCQHQDVRDRRTLAEAVRKAGGELGYEHFRPAEDALLWVSDALAWCHGAGGEWRRRVSALLDEVVDLDRV
ncbi:hypothetical protein [Saccharothrix sp. NRRL B-16314]|uniref:hypothetical protein n=1 Tax=Saccharothrix sp. NRRL B-16314 TaxID=1463825 RepID=UPI000524F70C|nr:hypothetical protein [Saccharothrix sp. NRRL B-16314]